jgi:chitinase
MRKSLFHLLLLLLIGTPQLQACKKSHAGNPTPANTNFRVVGYLMVGDDDAVAKAQRVNFSALTHLNLAFINPDANGTFADNPALTQIVKLAHDNKVKVLMSMGGGNIPVYFKNFLVDDKRAAFINAIMNVVTKYGFDGVDVDLEGDAVDQYYSRFVTGLADALAPQKKLITTAIATWFGDNVTDSAIARYDFINVMSYDKTGPWQPSKPGQHAPYSMAVSDLAYWGGTRGIAKERLNLGLPFYGYGFGGGAASTMLYNEIVAEYPGAENKDEITLSNGQTMYYNGIPTIKKKTTLALQQTGGVMIWELSQDAASNLSLLKSIQDVINGN